MNSCIPLARKIITILIADGLTCSCRNCYWNKKVWYYCKSSLDEFYSIIYDKVDITISYNKNFNIAFRKPVDLDKFNIEEFLMNFLMIVEKRSNI